MSKIIITLKSDLCAASGDGFSSVIDTDVGYDKFGFPVIGARRLKGCLRDAAKLIGTSDGVIDEIFGISGDCKSGSLKISDAHLGGYDEFKKEAVSSGLNAEEVISLFTYTRAATAIENDTAKDNSLRFTRVVKHYSPVTDDETFFEADVFLDEQYSAEFADICRALRNIGYKRNRGYGAVKCEFVFFQNEKSDAAEINENGDVLQITYLIKLKDNVMLPGNASDETIDHIPGTAVMGFFANEYLRSASPDERFEDMFLKNNVCFSNLYISDKDMQEYFPAPVILGKIKGEDGVFNIVTSENDDRIIKPVKSGYASFDSVIRNPLTETVYHHSRGEDKTLYTQTSLCSDQYFRGTITGKREYIKGIYNILTHSKLRFGRSKTAQYSSCELINAEISTFENEQITISAGEQFMVLLLSDVLVPDDMGGYDISLFGLQRALGNGIEKLECDKNEEVKRSALRYRIISGYNSKWNFQKPQVRTIAAGSTLVFNAETNMTLPKKFCIGAKNGEGFGNVLICRPSDFAVRSIKNKKQDIITDVGGLLSDLIKKNEKVEKMRAEAIEYVSTLRTIKNPSQIGRYIMMVKQAENYNQLCYDMVAKIKTESSRNFIDKLIKNSESIKYRDDLWREYLLLILTLIKYLNRCGEK